jgi:predicted dehydrogenase
LEHIKQPSLLHFERSLTATEFDVYDNPFRNLWLDELALLLKMVPAHVLKIDVGFSGDNETSSPRFHLFIRFDDGTTATLFVNTYAEKAVHKRVISGSFNSAEIDHLNGKLTVRELSEAGLRHSQPVQLGRDEPADIGLGDFLATIKKKSDPGYTIFDALKLTEAVETVDRQLARIF